MTSHHAVLAIAAAALLAGCESADDAGRVVGELTSDRVELVAEFAEPIVELLVAEGERVTAGQVLMRQLLAFAERCGEHAEQALAVHPNGQDRGGDGKDDQGSGGMDSRAQ